MDNDWCAVAKKLLDVLFGDVVDLCGHPVEVALSDMALLHNAFQKGQRRMVEFLLRYVPADDLKGSVSQSTREKYVGILFKPDMLEKKWEKNEKKRKSQIWRSISRQMVSELMESGCSIRPRS